MPDPAPVTFRRAHGVLADANGRPVVQEPELPPVQTQHLQPHEREVRRRAKPKVPDQVEGPEPPNPYDAVLADLERKQVEIEIAIKAIKALR